MKVKYIFWDFDGVIVDSELIYFEIWKEILPSDLVFNINDLHGKTNFQFIDSLNNSLDLIHLLNLVYYMMLA